MGLAEVNGFLPMRAFKGLAAHVKYSFGVVV
jgi:hypothetical protein